MSTTDIIDFCSTLQGPHCYCRGYPPKCCGCGKSIEAYIPTPKELPGLNCVHNHNGQGCGLCTPWKMPEPTSPIAIPDRKQQEKEKRDFQERYHAFKAAVTKKPVYNSFGSGAVLKNEGTINMFTAKK